jgi:hypothetical protein
MNRSKNTSADIENATCIFFSIAEHGPGRLLCAEEVSRCRMWSRKNRTRIKLGNRLIGRYRHDTGAVGAIDWDAFRDWLNQWMNDHAGLINFARLVVSVCMLLLML